MFNKIEVKQEKYKGWPVLSFFTDDSRIVSLGRKKLEVVMNNETNIREGLNKFSHFSFYTDASNEYTFEITNYQARILLAYKKDIKHFLGDPFKYSFLWDDSFIPSQNYLGLN